MFESVLFPDQVSGCRCISGYLLLPSVVAGFEGLGLRSAEATTIPIAAIVDVVSCRASNHDLLPRRSTREPGGLRAELARKGCIPSQGSRVVATGEVAVGVHVAISECVSVFLVRIAAESKHVLMRHRDAGRHAVIRLKDLCRIDMAEGARSAAVGRSAVGSGATRWEHGVVRSGLATSIHEMLIHVRGQVRRRWAEALRALLAPIVRTKVETVVIRDGMWRGSGRLISGSWRRVDVCAVQRRGMDGGGVEHVGKLVVRDHRGSSGREGEVLLVGASGGHDGVVIHEGIQRERNTLLMGVLLRHGDLVSSIKRIAVKL